MRYARCGEPEWHGISLVAQRRQARPLESEVIRRRSCLVRRGATGKGPSQDGTSPVAYSTQLGLSVHESDGFALIFFMFSGLWHSKIKEHRSISRVYLYPAEHTLFICSFVGSSQEERRFQARQEHGEAWNALSSGISASLLWSSGHSSVFVV